MLQHLKNVYRSLPPWLTAPVKYIPDSLLFGKSFRDCVPNTDVSIIGANLKRVLDYARNHTIWGRENIPYWISIEDAEKVVSGLPCVDSEQLRSCPERFVSDEATKMNCYWTTTGETGRVSTRVCLSNSAYGVEWAHMLKIWMIGGYCRKDDVKLTLRGYQFKPGELMRYDPIYNEISVDPFQLNCSNVKDVLKHALSRKVSCIHGYPTLINAFMELLKVAGQSLKVREIMLGSEGATIEQKALLADFFGARVVSWYGLTEKVVLAYDEFAQNRFKNFCSYGYPCVLNPDENGVGEIVGTSFVNQAMPLVNYKTGDYGRIVRENGALYIESLQGRSGKDFVWESTAIKYPITAINLPANIQDKIVYYQIVQNEYACIRVIVLPKKEWMERKSEIRIEFCSEIKKRLSKFDVVIEIVDTDRAFMRSKRGKFLMVVQNIVGTK